MSKIPTSYLFAKVHLPASFGDLFYYLFIEKRLIRLLPTYEHGASVAHAYFLFYFSAGQDGHAFSIVLSFGVFNRGGIDIG